MAITLGRYGNLIGIFVPKIKANFNGLYPLSVLFKICRNLETILFSFGNDYKLYKRYIYNLDFSKFSILNIHSYCMYTL